MHRKSESHRYNLSSSYGNHRKSESSKPEERWTIAKNCAITIIGLALTYYTFYFAFPVPLPPLATKADRIIFTLRLQGFSCLTLIAGIVYVAQTRFHTTAVDPIDGHGEHHVAVGVRYVTNTMEQLLMSVLGQLILATFLTEVQMKAIPVLVLFFVFGRAAFFFGYKKSYMKRTVGFACTFVPTIIVWIVNVAFIVSDLFP